MYIETVKNLFYDEIAETIAALAISQAIEYSGRLYGIPRTIVRSGRHCIIGWQGAILHGINGDVDILGENGTTCGQIPAKELCSLLEEKEFIIRSIIPEGNKRLIHNTEELARYLSTTPDNIPNTVRRYCDYETKTAVDDEGIVLTTTAGETGKRESRGLLYPFSLEAYDDAISGLQCWADATYWDAVHNGEV